MIKDLFEQFFAKYNGENVEAEDPSNLNQCMDLAFSWCDFIGIPRSSIRHLYAYQIFTQPTPETKQYWKLISNTPDGIPQVGDLVIFGTKVGIAGHVCISNGVGDAKTFQSLDQNWGTTPSQKKTQIVTHNYTGCLGWLRPILISGLPLSEQVIDWDDFEGNRHTVKWYVDEWQNEKTEKIKNMEKYSEDLKVKQDHIESLQHSGSEMNLQLVSYTKLTNTLTQEKESLRTQLESAGERLEKLQSENEILSQKLRNLTQTFEKLQEKMGILEKSKQIRLVDLLNFVKSKIKR
jgi:hypothetical protein